ncbi:toll/interleukin-1 receptor domain-containing protein [Kordiimonas aquimaris]|uniref:toll/interleukin-1 receptor domain-containing protein n=1 Tax=Kordiimonas aquimaris TaxID=707591 RepID=UPI0021D037A9|nr:toll/interleukin-1 receptor domain-containing protein [Kordiimonas aquimaris]
MSLYKYKAFISYSHADKATSKQLLNYLERFRIPKYLNNDYSHLKTSYSLGRFFRDREELAATGSLEDKIINAIEQSEYLIVLCSLASAKSKRVAFEIDVFLRSNSPSNILCILIDGEPNFDVSIGTDSENCIPEPLRELSQKRGKTPLAADMRSIGDGHNLAFKKIVAALLEVDMHDLMQREARRLQKKVMSLSVVGAAVIFALLGLVVNVQLAKNAEESAKNLALSQQKRAEDLIGFMVDDLVVSKLQKLGRIEVIDAVVNELVTHYVQQDDNSLTPDALGRKARVFMELGRVYLRRQDEKQAKQMFDQAYFVTKKMLEIHPESTSALYDHIHTLYWLGRYELVLGRFQESANYWRERVALFDRLIAQPDLNRRAYAEVGNLHIHLGWALMELGDYKEAKALFEQGLKVRMHVAELFQSDIAWMNNVAGAYHHLAWADEFLGDKESSIEYSRKSMEIYKKLWVADKTDQRAHLNLARSYRWLAESKYSAGQFRQAKQNLVESLEHLKPVLAFEPDDEDKQLQYCWSAVQLIEVNEKLNEHVPLDQMLKTYCPMADSIIHQGHVKAYNRLLSYRIAITDIEHQINEGVSTPQLQQSINSLTAQLNRETDQVLKSVMGKRIKLRHAIAVLKTKNNIENKVMLDIRNTVEHTENNINIAHPEMEKMLGVAKRLLSSSYQR